MHPAPHKMWSWKFVTITYPHHFGDNLPFDIVRLVVAGAGVILLFAILRVVIEAARREDTMPMDQFARFAAMAVVDLYISMTEVYVMGTPATPRLIIGAVGIGLSIYGVWGMRREQVATPVAYQKPLPCFRRKH